MRRWPYAFLLLVLSAHLNADEPVVAIHKRGSAIVPSLVSTVPASTRSLDTEAVDAARSFDEASLAVLPSHRREQCLTSLWSVRLGGRNAAAQTGELQRCIAEIDDAHLRLAAVVEAVRAVSESKRIEAADVTHRSVSFGDVQVPIAAIAPEIGPAAEACLDQDPAAAEACAEAEIEGPLNAHLQRPATTATSTTRALSTALTGAAAPAAGVAAFAASWEGIVIDAIAEQMVVQLKGAAATRLLNVFGRSICLREYEGTDVRSFFPDTCNLLLDDNIDTSSSDAIAQIPGEFQRTLRNDTLASLPGFLNAAVEREPFVAALGPIVLAFQEQADPFASPDPANTYCDSPSANETRVRACATYRLLLATRFVLKACDQASDCPAIQSVLAPAITQWKTTLGMDRAPEAADLFRAASRARTQWRGKQNDAVSRVVMLFEVIDALGKLDARDAAGMVLVRRWDRAGYGWARIALSVYRVAADFRRGYDPVALSNALFAELHCPGNTEGTYDAACALKFAAAAFPKMRTALAQFDTHPEATLEAKLQAISKELTSVTQDTGDPGLTAWSSALGLTAKVETMTNEAGPEFVQLYADVVAAKKLARLDRTAAQNEQLDALYERIIDNVFSVTADITSQAVPVKDAERAKRLVTNTGACWRAMQDRNWGVLANTLYSLALDTGMGKPFPPAIEQYRLLFTNLVTAQNPDAFEAAVSSYLSHTAAPDAKFESKTGLWLTGLPGVGVRGASSEDDAGIFAPVGIDWMLNPGWQNGRFRFALYGQLLDLGHLVSLKYDGNEETDASVKFRDVFAPGLYVRYPWRSGFSFGVGTAYVPTIADEAEGERKFRQRWNAFLSYDLSWVRLYGAGTPAASARPYVPPPEP